MLSYIRMEMMDLAMLFENRFDWLLRDIRNKIENEILGYDLNYINANGEENICQKLIRTHSLLSPPGLEEDWIRRTEHRSSPERVELVAGKY
jgi:hypothetical protein